MYMDGRWEYDHVYFQQMIKQEQQVNNEAVGAIITNLRKAIYNNLSSKDGSIPVLQERAREDSPSNEDSDSCREDGIYDNSEP